MIPISIPNLSGNEETYLRQCVQTGYVSSIGPFVTQFGEMLTDICKAPYCAPVSSGTAGLHVALVAAGVEQGDLVIMPSLTFIATANATAYCGADPWFMDVGAESWTLDPKQLKSSLSLETTLQNGQVIHKKTGRRVAAIMPVYMLGTPADINAISAIANDYRLPVICDAAAALGAQYQGQALGKLDVLATIFSFNGNKTFTCGGGGAVIGTDKVFMDRVHHLATTARTGTSYDHDSIGFNYRMTNISAAVGCAQIEQLDQFLQTKKNHADAYRNAFADIPHISGFPSPKWAKSAHWLSGIFLPEPQQQHMQSVITKIQQQGIDARAFWKPAHLQKPFLNAPRSDLKTTQSIYKGVLPLPCSTSLTSEDLQHTIASVKSVIEAVISD